MAQVREQDFPTVTPDEQGQREANRLGILSYEAKTNEAGIDAEVQATAGQMDWATPTPTPPVEAPKKRRITLADFRAKYPQYNKLSDETLSLRLQKKFYPDMPFPEFAKRMKVTSFDPSMYRNDGTKKGPGYMGTLTTPEGRPATEISIGVDFDGKERDIPSLVPTLTDQEIDLLVKGGKPTPEIVSKATEHAKGRIAAGKDPFAGPEDVKPRKTTVPDQPYQYESELATEFPIAEAPKPERRPLESVMAGFQEPPTVAPEATTPMLEGAPVRKDFYDNTKSVMEMATPQQRIALASEETVRGRVARDVLQRWGKTDELAAALPKTTQPAIRGLTGRIEDVAQSRMMLGQAIREQRIQSQERDERLAWEEENVGPVRRKWRDYEAGVVGSTGAALAFAGRKAGVDSMRDLGEAMDRWAAEHMPVEPTFADKLFNAVGSMSSFYLPGRGVMAGAQALSILAPTAAKWGGAGAMGVIEAAAEGHGTYDSLVKQGLDPAVASREADKAFMLNAAIIPITDKIAFFNDLKMFDEAGKLLKANAGRMFAQGAATEGPFQEGPQQVIQNYFTGRPLTEGLGEAVAIGSLVGGGTAVTIPAIEQFAAEPAAPKPPPRFTVDPSVIRPSPYRAPPPAAQRPFPGRGQQAPTPTPPAVPPPPPGAPTPPAPPSGPAPGTPADHDAVMGDKRPLPEIRAEQAAKAEQERSAAQAQAAAASGVPAIGTTATVTWPDGEVQRVKILDAYEGGAQVEADDGSVMDVTTEDVTFGAAPEGENTPASPIKVTTTEDVKVAEKRVEPEPTDAQKEAGNYRKGFVNISGLNIAIENPKGSERTGVDSDGERWATVMPATYGYIKRTEGADGDQVDVYVGENPDSQQVWLIDQVDPETKRFDETKALLGFPSKQNAVATYLAAFSDGSGKNRVGAITMMSLPEFKEWLKGDTTKSVAYRNPSKETPLNERLPYGGRTDTNLPSNLRQRGAVGEQFRGDGNVPLIPAPTQVPGAEIVPPETAVDRGPRDAEIVGDLGKGPSLLSELNRLAQGPLARTTVYPSVLGLGRDKQILRSIVQAIPVDVMDNLPVEQRTPEGLFRNEAVLEALAANAADLAANKPVELPRLELPDVTTSARTTHEPSIAEPSSKGEPSATETGKQREGEGGELPRVPPRPNVPEDRGEVRQGEGPGADAGGGAVERPAPPQPGAERTGDRGVPRKEAVKKPSGIDRDVARAFEEGKAAFLAGKPQEPPGSTWSFSVRNAWKRGWEEARKTQPKEEQPQPPAVPEQKQAQPAETKPPIPETKAAEPETKPAPVGLSEADFEAMIDAEEAKAAPAPPAPKTPSPPAVAGPRGRPNVVIMAVKDYDGNLTERIEIPYDGSREDMVRAAIEARRLAGERYEWKTEYYNTNSSTGATDATGAPRWIISPNGKNVAEIGSDEALYILGDVTKAPEAKAPEAKAEIPQAAPPAPPPAAQKPAAKPARKPGPTPEEQSEQDRMEAYFRPGRMVWSDYWQKWDKVLEFLPDRRGPGAWMVRVQGVNEDGSPVIEGGRPELPRLHSTVPNAKDIAGTLRREGKLGQEPAAAPQAAPPSPILTPLKEAGKEAAAGLSDWEQGLAKLFGGKGTLGMGPAFDEETYAKAKPFFQSGWQHFKAAGANLKEAAQEFIRDVMQKFGGTLDVKPYLMRFYREVIAKDVEDERTGVSKTGKGTLGEVAAGEGGGAEGAGQPGGIPPRGGGVGPAGDQRPPTEGVSPPRGGGSGAAKPHPAGAGAGGRPGAVGGRRTGGKRGRVPEKPPGVAPVVPEPPNIPAANFRITPEVRLGKGGEAEKFSDNIAAIKTLKAIETDQRRATPEEQRILARYVGWGGLANAFADDKGNFKPEWEARGKELAELLTPQEMRQARRTTRNAHFTSETIINTVWDAVLHFGFKGGMMLEHSIGPGNFIGLTPDQVLGSTKVIGVEYDSLTSRIAAQLYPQSTILHSGFQKVPLPDGEIQLNIGNPPFGNERLRFSFKPGLNHFSIHNQFVLAGQDALAPGGIQAMVVSRYLMDQMDSSAREEMATKVRLLGAIRLPDTAFRENARTDVVTDILFFQKLTPEQAAKMEEAVAAKKRRPEKKAQDESERQRLADKVPYWVETGKVKDPMGGSEMTVNQYFIRNPHMVMGRMERSGTMKPGKDGEKEINVKLGKDQRLEDMLPAAVGSLPRDVVQQEPDAIDNAIARFKTLSDALRIAVSGHEAGAIYYEDGKLVQIIERETPGGEVELTKRELTAESPWSQQLMQDKDGKWYRLEVKLDESGKPVKQKDDQGKATRLNAYIRTTYENEADIPGTLRLGQTRLTKLRHLVKLRDLHIAQITMETGNVNKAAMEQNRQKLRESYEQFVAEHGFINLPKNASVVGEMPDEGIVLSLEPTYRPELTPAMARRLNEKPRPAAVTPSPILASRQLAPYAPPGKAENAEDALAITLSEYGMVKMDRVASLLGKTEDEVIADLHTNREKPLIYFDPETNLWETSDAYLSGQVKRKLEAARSANLAKNIDALSKIQPEPWTADKVTPILGASWIAPEFYEAFLRHLTGAYATVQFSPITNAYNVVGNDDTQKAKEWSSPMAPVSWIVSKLLNSQSIRITTKDDDGHTIFHEEETALAIMKGKEIEREFSDWVFADTDRRTALVATFNDKFNTRVQRQHDGSHIIMPGKVPGIDMRRHQKNTIWRGIVERFLLMDHVVGSGKTYTYIGIAMERRRMKLSNKPVIVVPNHLVQQTANAALKLYPGAKVLAPSKKDFERKRRRRLFAKIATGDWDLVVMPESSFGFIDISPETEERFLDEELRIAQQAIDDAWAQAQEDGTAGGRFKPFNVKEAERLAEKIQSRIDKLHDRRRDRLLTFEQMGIDLLMVDEAHKFKNLFYSSRLSGVSGMNDKVGSQKAFDLYSKIRILRESPTGAVVFGTGTPISNSAVEMYQMMRYLAPEELRDLGIEHFDAWRAQYVDVTQKWEPTESGRLKEVNRLGRSWSNMRSLMDLYFSFTDSVTQEDINKWYAEDNDGSEFPIPKLKGGDRQRVVVKPTPEQSAALQAILDGFDGLPDIDDYQERNAERLRLMDQARKVSLDIRALHLYSKSKEEGGKLEAVSNRVADIYRKWNDDKGTQLIFLDRSVKAAKGDEKKVKEYDAVLAEQDKAIRENDEEAYRKASDKLEEFNPNEIEELRIALRGGWNAYDQIKENLIKQGIPANEIRFIGEANTDMQKQALFDAVNAGEVRVLIGSSEKMGPGTNVQRLLVALHHVDVTWKPSDIEQREGRILRQGNALYEKYPGFEVEIIAYVTERTVDAKLWDVNSTKLRTINGIRKYGGEFTMDFEDEESVSMAEIAALASGDPLLMERVKITAEIDKLELLERAFRRKQQANQDAIAEAERVLRDFPKQIEDTKAAAVEVGSVLKAIRDRAKERKATVEGKEVTSAFEAQRLVNEAVERQQAGDEKARYAVTINGKTVTNKEDIHEAIMESFGDRRDFEADVGEGETTKRVLVASRAITKRVNALSQTLTRGEESETKSEGIGTILGFKANLKLKYNKWMGESLTLYLTDKAGRTVAAQSANLDNSKVWGGATIRSTLDKLIVEAEDAEVPRTGWLEDRIKKATEDLPRLKSHEGDVFEQAQELETKHSRLVEIIRELSSDTGKKDITTEQVARAFTDDEQVILKRVSNSDTMQEALEWFVGAYREWRKHGSPTDIGKNVLALYQTFRNRTDEPERNKDKGPPKREPVIPPYDPERHFIRVGDSVDFQTQYSSGTGIVASIEQSDDGNKYITTTEGDVFRLADAELSETQPKKEEGEEEEGEERFSLGTGERPTTDVAAEVRSIIEQLAPRANLEMVDRLFAEGEALKLSGSPTGAKREVAGSYEGLRNLITVALGYADPTKTARHEAIHALRAMGLFTEAEWKVLEREAEARFKARFKVRDTEESVAKAFEDFRAGGSYGGLVRKAFERIREFLTRLGNKLRGLGFQSAEDVFARVESGEVGRRTMADMTLEEYKALPKEVRQAVRDDLNAVLEKFSTGLRSEFYDRMILLGNTYWKIGASVRQNSYPGSPAKIIEIDTKRGHGPDSLYRLEIDTRNAPDAQDENGEHEDTKYSWVTGEELEMLNPLPEKFALETDQTKTPEFKRWFGDSKVVDAAGRPLVVYHGTSEDFSEFSMEGRRYLNGLRTAGASWFTPSPERAWWASEQLPKMRGETGGAPRIMPVYLALQNPEIVQQFSAYTSKDQIAKLKQAGRDGVIVSRTGKAEDAEQIIAFDPTQIKSAIGNVGTFDPANSDIRYSLGQDLPDNIAVTPRQENEDQNPLKRFFWLPRNAWNNHPILKAFQQFATQIEIQLAKTQSNLTKEYKGIRNRFRGDQEGWDTLTDALWVGDAQGKEFTEEELRNDLGWTSEKLITAYKDFRKLVEKVGRLVDMHRRSMLPKYRRRKAAVIERMRSLTNMSSAEFRSLYGRRSRIRSRLRAGLIRDEEGAQRILDEIERELQGMREQTEEYQDLLQELDRLDGILAQTSIRRREGYVPHKFFGTWAVYRIVDEPVMDEQGNPVLNDDGTPKTETRYKLVAGKHGFFPDFKEAIATAKRAQALTPDDKFVVRPVQFKFPNSAATMLTDASYWKLMANASQAMGVSGQDLRDMMAGVARTRYRRRISGFTQFRRGIEGFSKDMDRVMQVHISEATRYVFLDKLKYRAINDQEKLGLSPHRSENQRFKTLSAMMEAYLRDMNGQKQPVERSIDSWLNKILDTPWGKPALAGMPAVSVGLFALAGNPYIAALAASYVGYRLYSSLGKGSDFKSRSLTQDMLTDMAHAKLGILFNVASAVVNLSQTAITTLPVLGPKYTMTGMVKLEEALRSKLMGKPNADYRLLERSDVLSAPGYTETDLIQFQRERLGRLSLFFFRNAENFNRAVSFLGAYHKAKDRGATPAKAFQKGEETMGFTQFRYGPANTPEALRNVFARLPAQFKKFLFNAIAFTFELGRKAKTGKSIYDEEVDIPRMALATHLASLFFVAGAIGLPFVSILAALIHAITGWDPLEEMKRKALEMQAASKLEAGAWLAAVRGFPAWALGEDMSARAGMGEQFVPNTLQDILGPWYGTVDRAIQLGKLEAGFVDQVANVSPGIGKPLKSIEAAANGMPIITAATDTKAFYEALADNEVDWVNPWKNRTEFDESILSKGDLVRMAIGSTPTKSALAKSEVQGIYQEVTEDREKRQKYMNRIVSAHRTYGHNDEKLAAAMEKIFLDAEADGVVLTERAITNALTDAKMPRIQRAMKGAPRHLRENIYQRGSSLLPQEE